MSKPKPVLTWVPAPGAMATPGTAAGVSVRTAEAQEADRSVDECEDAECDSLDRFCIYNPGTNCSQTPNDICVTTAC